MPGFIKDWLREEFSECLGEELVESSLDQLDDDAWHWEDPKTYSLLHPPENPYKTYVRFQALPDYLAGGFLKNPRVCFGKDVQYQLTFYRVVTLDQGAELMSWPPQRVPLIRVIKKEKQEVGEAYISFFIRFKLQTIPWRNNPIIYHQLSVRRWIKQPFDQFPYRGATAYIGDNRRWLDGVHQLFCFIPLQIKQRITQEGREPRWSKAISELLKLNDSPLPDPNTLASEPAYNWSTFGEEPVGIQGAIAYDTRHRSNTLCIPGVSPLDFASLDWAIQNKEEIFYEGSLGSLRIKTQHVQDLTQRLDLEHPSVKGKNRQQKRVNLLDEHIQQIASYLPKPEGLCGALIEIKPKTSFFPPESDPKLALRIGAMQAGYVNQHIHPLTARKKSGEEYVTKDARNRVQKAVSDLLRQFGILPAPLIDLQKDGISSNLWLMCFHVLRRTRKTTASNTPSTVALMVRVNPLSGIVKVTTPSLFPTWVSYPVGLGYLINEKWNFDSYADETTGDSSEEQPSSDKKREQQFFNDFVTKCLRDCLNTPTEKDRLPRVLFMAEAQNSRKMLTWLKNPELPANNLPAELKRDMTESEISRLWVVRLRVADNGEVPVGIVKGSPGSRTSGVFRWQDVCDDGDTKVYLSIRRLLNTEQGTNTLQQKQSRLDNGSRQAGNPKLLEIAVVHHPGIERNKLACFVHNLRARWPYFADEVSLPLPFPFATLAKEYAVSAKDAVESEEPEESLD